MTKTHKIHYNPPGLTTRLKVTDSLSLTIDTYLEQLDELEDIDGLIKEWQVTGLRLQDAVILTNKLILENALLRKTVDVMGREIDQGNLYRIMV